MIAIGIVHKRAHLKAPFGPAIFDDVEGLMRQHTLVRRELVTRKVVVDVVARGIDEIDLSLVV